MSEKPVCIIPARGGSKRIPRKNILPFNGRPLISWSIKTALESDVFSQVIVSTDDDEIREVAMEAGATIPFVRSEDLANDYATTAEVLLDALSRIEHSKHACCLYPTAPLLKAEDFRIAYANMLRHDADSIIAVTEYDFHPLRAFEVDNSNRLSFKWQENAHTRSQDLPQLLHDAGAFYFFNTDRFKASRALVMEKTIGHPIERMRAVDIDTPQDFEFAELLHKHQKKPFK